MVLAASGHPMLKVYSDKEDAAYVKLKDQFTSSRTRQGEKDSSGHTFYGKGECKDK